jgi:prepilin-type N-terminal cleavage/methylation domain-containing protein
MKMIKLAKENKGYSLVEMVIVMAIVAIMAAGSLVTITLINSAKAKEAGVTLDSEITALVAKSKSQLVEFNYDKSADGVISDSDKTNSRGYYFAIAVYQGTDGKYYISHGYYNPDDSGKKTYIAFADDNTNDGKGTCISKRVSIDYDGVDGAAKSGLVKAGASLTTTDITTSGTNKDVFIIAFDKAGRCISGVGTYDLKKSSTNVSIDTITIRANGSRQSN